MKKHLKLIALACAALTLIACFASCGAKEKIIPDSKKIIGEWKCDGAEFSGFVFGSDGTGSLDTEIPIIGTTKVDLTYSLDQENGKLTVEYDLSLIKYSKDFSYKFTEDGKLELTDELGISFTYVKTEQ